jgi:hypothetical protein
MSPANQINIIFSDEFFNNILGKYEGNTSVVIFPRVAFGGRI